MRQAFQTKKSISAVKRTEALLAGLENFVKISNPILISNEIKSLQEQINEPKEWKKELIYIQKYLMSSNTTLGYVIDGKRPIRNSNASRVQMDGTGHLDYRMELFRSAVYLACLYFILLKNSDEFGEDYTLEENIKYFLTTNWLEMIRRSDLSTNQSYKFYLILKNYLGPQSQHAQLNYLIQLKGNHVKAGDYYSDTYQSNQEEAGAVLYDLQQFIEFRCIDSIKFKPGLNPKAEEGSDYSDQNNQVESNVEVEENVGVEENVKVERNSRLSTVWKKQCSHVKAAYPIFSRFLSAL